MRRSLFIFRTILTNQQQLQQQQQQELEKWNKMCEEKQCERRCREHVLHLFVVEWITHMFMYWKSQIKTCFVYWTLNKYTCEERKNRRSKRLKRRTHILFLPRAISSVLVVSNHRKCRGIFMWNEFCCVLFYLSFFFFCICFLPIRHRSVIQQTAITYIFVVRLVQLVSFFPTTPITYL